ncbi:MAG: tRNA pseudouridine(38-40) synthase TruA [Aquificota bacterium]|nr:tRNA pseudouridine(38-40) synthase TruA [Aquificota bacterium]
MWNYLLRLSFVGTNYSGWQIQPHTPTVQGEITRAVSTVFGEEVKVTGCCRTDSGVHARDYVANFKASRYIEEVKVLRGLNSLLPRDIGVKEVKVVGEDFNARYSVKGKVYIYRIWNEEFRDPFLYPFSWHLPVRLDREAIEEAVRIISGRHDFSGFAKVEGERNTVIDLKVGVSFRDGLIEISFTASHFLRYMVRRITGALTWVGQGRIKPEDLRRHLGGKTFPYTAPPQGLTLERVLL